MQKTINLQQLSDRELDYHIAELFRAIKSDYEELYSTWCGNKAIKEQSEVRRKQIQENTQKLNAALDVDHFRRESMR